MAGRGVEGTQIGSGGTVSYQHAPDIIIIIILGVVHPFSV